jgi:predicted kinase
MVEHELTVPAILLPHLQRTPSDPRPVVLMTCGLAGRLSLYAAGRLHRLTRVGAGKTTLVKSVLRNHPHFTRISIDDIIYKAHGIYGVDYPASPSMYDQYMNEADEIYLDTFRRLLTEGKDVAFERACYAKDDRDEWRKIAEDGGARVVLVLLQAKDKEILWTRIRTRSTAKKTADSALDISRETFEMYWNGFENPDGEGEIIIDVV